MIYFCRRAFDYKMISVNGDPYFEFTKDMEDFEQAMSEKIRSNYKRWEAIKKEQEHKLRMAKP